MTRVHACGKKVLEKRTKITYYCYHPDNGWLSKDSGTDDTHAQSSCGVLPSMDTTAWVLPTI